MRRPGGRLFMDYMNYFLFFSKILETVTIFFVLTLTVCDPCGQDAGSEVLLAARSSALTWIIPLEWHFYPPSASPAAACLTQTQTHYRAVAALFIWTWWLFTPLISYLMYYFEQLVTSESKKTPQAFTLQLFSCSSSWPTGCSCETSQHANADLLKYVSSIK